MTTPPECPKPDVLSRFTLGQLTDTVLNELSSHLDHCSACRQKIDSLFAVDDAALAIAASVDDRFFGEAQLQRALSALSSVAGLNATESINGNRSPVSDLLQQVGHYRIVRELGAGGMGKVYLAEDQRLSRPVALKVVKAKFASEQESRRFQLEAEAVAMLHHPHIVSLYEVGEHEGQRYLTMAYVEGQTLGERIKAGPLPPLEAASLVRQIAEAVHYAHTVGVIHRDLKPSNILVDLKGQARLLDFGLAKRSDSDSDLTQSGQVMGTPGFMPPEQAEGKNEQVGAQSDVYSLGATLYCLLTGRWRQDYGPSPALGRHGSKTARPVRPHRELSKFGPTRCLTPGASWHFVRRSLSRAITTDWSRVEKILPQNPTHRRPGDVGDSQLL